MPTKGITNANKAGEIFPAADIEGIATTLRIYVDLSIYRS
jgi:hypothetical protein